MLVCLHVRFRSFYESWEEKWVLCKFICFDFADFAAPVRSVFGLVRGYKWGRDSTALTGSVVEDHTKLMVRSIMFDKYFTKHLRSHKPGQQGAWEEKIY